MKRKFGFFDVFRKNDAEIQYQFAMQNLQNGAYEEAVRLLLLSANQGFPLAQLELADCYADGHGVAMNPSEAFSWYYKAACSGNPDAQYEVAGRSKSTKSCGMVSKSCCTGKSLCTI